MKLTLFLLSVSVSVLLLNYATTGAQPTSSPTSDENQSQDVAYLQNTINKLQRKIALLKQQMANAVRSSQQSSESSSNSSESVEVVEVIDIFEFDIGNISNVTSPAWPSMTTPSARRRRNVPTTTTNSSKSTESDESTEKTNTTEAPPSSTNAPKSNHRRRRFVVPKTTENSNETKESDEEKATSALNATSKAMPQTTPTPKPNTTVLA